MLTKTPVPSSAQRGLSLVELMVGITIGLFVVAAASIVVTTQLRENRQLLVETQLQQDLRASADIIAREIRRSGYAKNSQTAVWNADAPATAVSDYQQLDVTPGTQGTIQYRYEREDGVPGPFKYELVGGIIKAKLGAGTVAQDLTDKSVLYVEALRIDQRPLNAVRLQCPIDCPLVPPPGSGADYCWPTTAVREISVTIRGRTLSEPVVRREVTSRVRLRNDLVTFHADSPQGCPK